MQTSKQEVTENISTTVRKLHFACERNDIQQVSDTLKLLTIRDLHRVEKYENNTALNIASYRGHHQVVRMLLEHGDFMMKRNRNGGTPFSQAKDDRTKRTFVQFQQIAPRFAGDLLEWTIAYREPAIKRAQIRQHLSHAHFISQSFETVSRRYIRCYLAIEGFTLEEIDQLETIGYTSVDGFIRAYTSPMRFYKIINRHLAKYALAYFDSSFDITIPYSFVHCLLSIIAMILHEVCFRSSLKGQVYRGMLMATVDLYKYVVGSQVLNTAFLSTSKDRLVAEIFAGINEHQTASTHDSSQVNVLCSYTIRNSKTAYDIKLLSKIDSESEVLILPFSAFRVARVERISSNIVRIDLDECDEKYWSAGNDGEEFSDSVLLNH
jgi:hypothetical protein